MPTFLDGSILVPSDVDTTAAILDPTTGATLGTATLSMCEVGDILPDGTFALGRTDAPLGQITHLDIYNRDGTLIVAVPYDDIFPEFPAHQAWAFAPIRGDGDSTFYVCDDKGGLGRPDPTVRTVSKAGVVGGTTYHPAGDGFGTRISAMAPSRDGQYLYYALDDIGTPIYRHRLTDDTDMGVWVAGVAGSAIYFDIFTLDSGDVLVLIQPDTAVTPSEWQVRRFDASGVLQASYDIPAGEDESFIFVALDHGDPSVFWVRSFPDGGAGGADLSTFRQYRISDGTVLTEFDKVNTSNGGDVPVSCPFFILRSSSVCVPEMPSVSCWNGGTPTVGCANPQTGPTRAGCWNSHSMEALRVSLNGE